TRFIRRYSSVPEEKYALKHELESAKGALNKRINQVDSKHDNKHHDLKLLVYTFMESQKPLNTTLKSIDGKMETLNVTMAGYKDRLVAMEYKQSDQDRRLNGIEEAQKRKREHNTKIIIALIGEVYPLETAALDLRQCFF